MNPDRSGAYSADPDFFMPICGEYSSERCTDGIFSSSRTVPCPYSSDQCGILVAFKVMSKLTFYYHGDSNLTHKNVSPIIISELI